MSYCSALTGGAARFTTDVTNVDCEKQVRSWRLLRSVSELLLPTCNCGAFYHDDDDCETAVPPPLRTPRSHHRRHHSASSLCSSTTIVKGTIYGYRHGKVRLCIQEQPNSQSFTTKTKAASASASASAPFNTILFLLELAVPTSLLAREMRGGVLRIALECRQNATSHHHHHHPYNHNNNKIEFDDHHSNSSALLSAPVWTMYCNGKRVGFAGRRQPGKADLEVLRKMGSMVAGAGVIELQEAAAGSDIDDHNKDKDVMYLRGNFERVCGSSDAESFRLIEPDGCIDQELSIFFVRSRTR